MCKELLQLNNKCANNPIKNGKETEQIFFKDMQIPKKHMKICFILLVISEMQIKTTMRYHFTFTIMAII